MPAAVRAERNLVCDDVMGKVIAVSSGKGGTGKTTTVAAVSSCLAALGYKTLCVDFDAGLKSLDLSLCMSDYAVADFYDVLDGRTELADACHECPRISNLYFLAAPPLISPEEISPEAVPPFFDAVRAEFDFCLVDAPSGIGAGFRLAHAGADMSILVTAGELPAVRDAQRASDAARDMGVSDVRLLVNRIRPRRLERIRTTVDDVIDTIGARLIGIVPEDDSVFHALHENIPLVLYKKRRAAYDFLDIARRIAGEEIPIRTRRAAV